MYKRLWNALQLEFAITPKGPLLVKSAILSPNPSLPDMQFVRTVTANGEQVFIPGTSLKGIFRSFSEKALRTVNSQYACDPFSEEACGRKLKDEMDSAMVYRQSCHACRLYGNTRLRGRIAFCDAFPDGEVKTETRYGVAISRLTNAVAQGPFDMEIVVAGNFSGKLVLENFEVWQLGLVGLTIRAINDGLVRIGFGKNRGFGEVGFVIKRAILDLAPLNDNGVHGELWGIGRFTNADERCRYGLRDNDRLTGLSEPSSQSDLGIFMHRVYDERGWWIIAEKAIEHLMQVLEVSV